MLTPSETRWGFGLPIKDIDLPEEQITRHYFVDLWADMCKEYLAASESL